MGPLPRIYVAWAKHSRHQRMLLQLWLDIKLHVPNNNMDPPPPQGFRQSEPITTAIKGCHSSCDWTSNYLIGQMYGPPTRTPPPPRFRQSEPSTAAIKGCYSSCDWTSDYLIGFYGPPSPFPPPPPPPIPGLGSLSQAQPPSKDATPAVIGHQTA